MRVAALFGLVLLASCAKPAPPVQDPVPPDDLSDLMRYPADEWDHGKEGQSVIMVHVTETGDVDSSYVARTSGYPAFDSAAVVGVRGAHFTPGRRGEERVPMWVRIPVRFSRGHGIETDGSGAAQ